MQCNIDQRGRQARLVTGTAVDALGIFLLVAGLYAGKKWMMVAGAVLCFSGLFMIFEGVKGWCAVRAMGFKTKI